MCAVSSRAAAAEGLATSIVKAALIQTLQALPSGRLLIKHLRRDPLTACGSVKKSQSISGAVSLGSEPIC